MLPSHDESCVRQSVQLTVYLLLCSLTIFRNLSVTFDPECCLSVTCVEMTDKSYLEDGSPGSPRAAAAAANCCWGCGWAAPADDDETEELLVALAKCCRKGKAAEYPFATNIAAAAAAFSRASLFPPLLPWWPFKSGPEMRRVGLVSWWSFSHYLKLLTFSIKVRFLSKPWLLCRRESQVWDNIWLRWNGCRERCRHRTHHACHGTPFWRSSWTTVLYSRSFITEKEDRRQDMMNLRGDFKNQCVMYTHKRAKFGERKKEVFSVSRKSRRKSHSVCNTKSLTEQTVRKERSFSRLTRRQEEVYLIWSRRVVEETSWDRDDEGIPSLTVLAISMKTLVCLLQCLFSGKLLNNNSCLEDDGGPFTAF